MSRRDKDEWDYRNEFEEKAVIVKNDGTGLDDLNQLLEDKWSTCCSTPFDGGVLIHLERKLPK